MNHLLSPNKVIAGARYHSPEAGTLLPKQRLLKMLITPTQFVVLTIELLSKKVSILQPYKFSRVTNENEWISSIEEVFDKEPLLKELSAENKAGIFTQNFTLIPSTLQGSVSTEEILEMNCNIPEKSIVYSDWISKGTMQLAYALPDGLMERFPISESYKITHSLSGLLNYLLLNAKGEKERLHVYIQASSFQLILIRNQALHFCNSFHYESPEDFMYHLLFTCKQLKVDAEIVPLTLMGELVRDSSLFQLLTKYIRLVEFAGPVKELNFNPDYPIPAHFFFNLYCL